MQLLIHVVDYKCVYLIVKYNYATHCAIPYYGIWQDFWNRQYWSLKSPDGKLNRNFCEVQSVCNSMPLRILYKWNSVQNTGTCFLGQGWFVRNLGRSPGVPDKSSRGLSSMSRYSAQILICFIAYIFLFSIPLWVWLGTLQDCQYAQCPLPLSIVIRMRLVIRQSKLPACLADVQLAHQNTLWHLCHSLVKLIDKMDEYVSMGSFQHKSQVNGESFAYMWVIYCISA